MRYREVIICLLTLLVVFSSTVACTVKYINKVTIFEIKGEVYDNDSQWPIENVTVSFVDTGYDDIRSKEPFPVTIGYSEADGKILARLNYLWRSKDTTHLKPTQKTFEIVLTHENYTPKRFHFDESYLKHGEIRFEINLERVYMSPQKDENPS